MSLVYEQYIRSDRWSRRRWLYFAGHDRRCQLCGSPEKVHLHHRTYERMGAELDADLVPLCEGCHSLVHQLQRDRGCTVEEATDRALGAMARPSFPASMAKRRSERPRQREKGPCVERPRVERPPVGKGQDPMASFFAQQRNQQHERIKASQARQMPSVLRRRRDREAARLRAVYRFQTTGERPE